MAIQDDERQKMIDAIKSFPQAYQDVAAMAFRMGHEEGWWLARTDPDSTVSPPAHEIEVNPFNNGIAKVMVEPYKKWGVEYKDVVTEYESEKEARRQHLLATWDVPATLVSSVDGGKTWITEAPGGYLP